MITQTLPQHSLSSLSRNFQRFEVQHCRELLGFSDRELIHSTQLGGSIPKMGPSPPGPVLLSVIVLTKVVGWGREWVGSRGVKPCLFCLGVLESRSWLDLIFSLLPSLFFFNGDHCQNLLFFNPCCLFHFSPSRPMCHTHPATPPLPLSCLPSLAAPNARRLSGISSCPLCLGEGGRWRREHRQCGGRRKGKEMWQKERRYEGYDVTVAFELWIL